MQFENDIRVLLAQYLPSSTMELAALLQTPTDSEHGDYAIPCFAFAKQLQKSPQEIAYELAQTITHPDIAEARAIGPYINIYLTTQARAKQAFQTTLQQPKTNKKVLIEFPSPNTNKPLHLGHLRNMLLGEATARILEMNGNTVIRVNLNNDRGIHICKSMLAYDLYANNQTPQEAGIKSDHFVGKWYVEYAKQQAQQPELQEQAQKLLRLWEQKDERTLELWKKLDAWAKQGFKETYTELGIFFDKEYNEHEFYEQAKQFVQEAEQNGIFTRDEQGNTIAELGALGKKVVLRADGTAVYSTQDIGLAKLKQQDYAPDEQIYVVGDEQKHYFTQLFAIFDQLQMKDKRHHLSYGMISLPSGKMKSREGNVVDCDELLAEMRRLAETELTTRYPELDVQEVQHRAKTIGYAALKFYMLKYDPKTGFVYDAQESISLEGETAPYIQYAIARIHSILQEQQPTNQNDYSQYTTPEDITLLRTITKTKDVIVQAGEQYKPHYIARHAITLAQAFTAYYHTHKILGVAHTNERLHLIKKTQEILKELLNLLGIDALEEM